MLNYPVLAQVGTVQDRDSWFKENNIHEYDRMIFSKGKYYYIFKNSNDAMKFKIMWG